MLLFSTTTRLHQVSAICPDEHNFNTQQEPCGRERSLYSRPSQVHHAFKKFCNLSCRAQCPTLDSGTPRIKAFHSFFCFRLRQAFNKFPRPFLTSNIPKLDSGIPRTKAFHRLHMSQVYKPSSTSLRTGRSKGPGSNGRSTARRTLLFSIFSSSNTRLQHSANPAT